MCGIAGQLHYDPSRAVDPHLIRQMVGMLAHRGPDGNGVHVKGQVGLGHTRLSIIDLHTGAQPITNEDGTVWLVYNGEIYNFQELRQELIAKGHRFRSTSDTEVIVHLYEEEGTACVSRLRGMFAFALWDEREQLLFCARDRVGIKPFYYCDNGSSLIFGSEIKALLPDPALRREIDLQAIDQFLAFSYVPGESTLLRSVRKLPPGHTLVVRDGVPVMRRYWDLSFEARSPYSSIGEAAEALEALVRSTVKDHMISDVPVGILLSGGVDSTIVLACAAQETNKRIQTFTVGFDGAEFADERPYAKLAAERFGADYHAITISPAEFSGFMEDYVWHMEEPVYEAPAVALHYVSKLARQHVKVVLSGEGGDEAFGGYHNYRNLLLMEKVKAGLGQTGSAMLSGLMSAAGKVPALRKLKNYAPLVDIPLSSYYFSRRSSPFTYFSEHRERFYGAKLRDGSDPGQAAALVGDLFSRVKNAHPLHQMLYVDTNTWLPDDLLVKADKMTMANSLELRVPFLDHKMLEFAASLPPEFKVKGLQTKRVLKAAFNHQIPEAIVKRKKVGFPVPIAQWLRSDLREFVNDTLLSERSLSRGYFERAEVRRLVTDCMAGAPVTTQVFSLLALELWHRRFADNSTQFTAAAPAPATAPDLI